MHQLGETYRRDKFKAYTWIHENRENREYSCSIRNLGKKERKKYNENWTTNHLKYAREQIE